MKLLLLLFLRFAVSAAYYPVGIPQFTQPPEEWCIEGPKGRVPWILSRRQPDYGWKEHTHRANIAVAVYGYRGTTHEMEQMRKQLEVEVTNALMRNSEFPIYDNDLALLIHALIASNINPRNFHGIDLVAELRKRVDNETEPHPFLVLALCNSHAVEFDDLNKLRRMATLHQNKETRKELEMKALALKAFACAASLNRNLNKFDEAMTTAARCLASKQSLVNGSFGNAYTTSLIVQALTAYGKPRPAWNRSAAIDFLLYESEIAVNMIKAYYIEMALNSHNVTFIKDLYTGGPMTPPKVEPDAGYYIQYTIQGAERPDTYFSVTTRVRPHTDFFTIMQNIASQCNEKFQFSYYYNEKNEPMVYKMDGIPNDAEENKFWRICVQRRRSDKFQSEPFISSPQKLIPAADQHIIMWYRDSECPTDV